MFDKFMKVAGLIHPTTRQLDVMLFLVVFVVVAVVLKFFLTGVVITLGAHTITFGSMDGWSYGSVLSPVLAAHGFNSTRNSIYGNLGQSDTRYVPEDPDQGENE
jgi:hypothetical protein